MNKQRFEYNKRLSLSNKRHFVLQKIKDLEEDLEVEARAKAEQQKAIKKNDRKLKELMAQAEEDRRNLEKLQDTNDRQNKKLTQLRRRAEEAVG